MAEARLRGRKLQARRKAFFDEHPLCAGPDSECEKQGRVTAATELDHITPLHKGGADDTTNAQGLCRECHAAKTTRDMNHKPKGCDEAGMPTDPRHHWHTGR